ncbi:MAG: hypothetical protein O6928_03320 [Gammaproteobacteria bacterium]|nr:hypothetical protein [Gammaproteobacteria bacterium]
MKIIFLFWQAVMLSKNRAHVDVFDGKNITIPIQIEKAVISLTI